MLLVNTNSKIINPAPAMPTWIREQRQLGRDRFRAGEPIQSCTSVAQKRGWWAALDAQADAETHAYLSGGRRS